jgi:putative pyruvate formate lyase activating enzyme
VRPAYLDPGVRATLERRASAARERMSPCRLCPAECGARRLEGETGRCRTAAVANVSSAGPHFGEEAPLVGSNGSGTIFFSGCGLGCLFCQNWETSRNRDGQPVAESGLAAIMLRLQEMGCENINLVTPTHVVPHILGALPRAIDAGLRIPIVYNTGGYEQLDTLRLLDGVVDIYMPDLKWMRPWVGREMAGAPEYTERAKKAILEMHRQVGDLRLDERGVAVRGLLVRHLVLPHGLAGSRAAFRFIARRISRNTYVNVMDQYRPCGDAVDHAILGTRLTAEEYRRAVRAAAAEGLWRLDQPAAHLGGL